MLSSMWLFKDDIHLPNTQNLVHLEIQVSRKNLLHAIFPLLFCFKHHNYRYSVTSEQESEIKGL